MCSFKKRLLDKPLPPNKRLSLKVSCVKILITTRISEIRYNEKLISVPKGVSMGMGCMSKVIDTDVDR